MNKGNAHALGLRLMRKSAAWDEAVRVCGWKCQGYVTGVQRPELLVANLPHRERGAEKLDSGWLLKPD